MRQMIGIGILVVMSLRSLDDMDNENDSYGKFREMSTASAINDLLQLLHEEWVPEDRKNIIKNMLVDMIDKMEDNLNMDDLR